MLNEKIDGMQETLDEAVRLLIKIDKQTRSKRQARVKAQPQTKVENAEVQ